MRKLATLVRSNPMFIDKCIRGPKKKGQIQAKIQSNDIINIFKDGTDPQPRDIKQYPLFVQQMSLGMSSIHQLLMATQLGIKHRSPMKSTYKSFLRGIKRQRFKSMRQYKQLDLVDIEKSQKFDAHERSSVYDIFGKSDQELEEQRKAAQAAQAAQEEEDDE